MFEHVVTTERTRDGNAAQVISVTELNHLIARQLRIPQLSGLYVRGQVSGFGTNSGNWYFDLKDSNEVIVRCAAWRSSNVRMQMPKNGDQVIARGTVNFYEARGSVTFVVDSLQSDGQSALYLRFLQLKEQLKAEGLFDPERKRMLPKRPRKIAVVTSQTGAVIHDICRVARNRDPGVAIVLLPVPVQGASAAPGIVRGIEVAATIPEVDVLIVGRGGGSMEDLWCFNDERVVRAIAASPVPVVSGVGHDTDVTLSDFATDVRAATPSQAAELAVPDLSGIRTLMKAYKQRLEHAVSTQIDRKAMQILKIRGHLEKISPSARMDRLEHRAGLLSVRLSGALEALLNTRQFDVDVLRTKLSETAQRVPEQAQRRVDQVNQRMTAASPEKKALLMAQRISVAKLALNHAVDQGLSAYASRTNALQMKLSAMNPNGILERGYAFVTSGEHIIQSAAQAPYAMTLHFRDGQVHVHRSDNSEVQNGKNNDI